MSDLDIFRKDYLHAKSWEQRRDGIPLDLLDNLLGEELVIAEDELIDALSLGDDWPVIGLGHIKSVPALPKLGRLLKESSGAMKVKIAYSIFQICEDDSMKDIVIATLPTINNPTDIISVLHFLPNFKDEKISALLYAYSNHSDYLVAYNATRYLGLPVDGVIERFRKA